LKKDSFEVLGNNSVKSKSHDVSKHYEKDSKESGIKIKANMNMPKKL